MQMACYSQSSGYFILIKPEHFTDVLGDADRMVGVMDLGGGSTQVTFIPSSKVTLSSAPVEYLVNTDIFGKTHKLYTHRLVAG